MELGGEFLEDDWTFDSPAVLLTDPVMQDDGAPLGEARLSCDGSLGGELSDGELASAEPSAELELNPFDGLPFSSMYYELLAKRKQLPVWRAKDDFVLAVDESAVVIVTGRTGSGKSSQIPQWCARFAKETNLEHGTVVCSQPFPHAAESLAIQAAREMDFTSVGHEVGYVIPQMHNISDDTLLKFCTDEILLREMAEDPLLRKYNFVVVDEFQQRTTATDLLLALFKLVLPMREDLRLVVISQPHEMPKLEEFFEGVPIVDLHFLDGIPATTTTTTTAASGSGGVSEEGGADRRQTVANEQNEQLGKVEMATVDTRSEQYVGALVELVCELHCQNQFGGDFLVFLPSAKEIYEACDLISREIAIRALRSDVRELRVLPLHRSLSVGAQQAVYEARFTGSDVISESSLPSSFKRRHVIVCDDVAESSFSLDGVDVVIDTNLMRESSFNSRLRTTLTSVRPVPTCSSKLRLNRCRSGGKYFKFTFDDMTEQPTTERSPPKITCTELSGSILLAKRILHRIGLSFNHCQLLDPPAPEAYMLALEELDYHGALDENGSLSDLGIVMSEIPLSVSQAKVLITSCGEDCTEEIVTILAMLNSPPCFVELESERQEAMLASHRKFFHRAGDHFTYLNVHKEFIAHKRSESWCDKNHLNYDALQTACKRREELLAIMDHLELPISPPVNDELLMETSVKKALLAGDFMQLARDTDGSGNYHIIRDKHTARLHPDSNLDHWPAWILYHHFHVVENNFLSGVCSVSADLIAEIVPTSYILNLPPSESQNALIDATEKQKRSAQPPPDSTATTTTAAGNSSENDGGDDDDDDIISQTVRDLSDAYNRSSAYLRNADYLGDEGQCVVQ